MTPSARHELYKEPALRLVHEFAALKGWIVESRGATTYKREGARQGGSKVKEQSRGMSGLGDAIRHLDQKVDRFREELSARIDALDQCSGS